MGSFVENCVWSFTEECDHATCYRLLVNFRWTPANWVHVLSFVKSEQMPSCLLLSEFQIFRIGKFALETSSHTAWGRLGRLGRLCLACFKVVEPNHQLFWPDQILIWFGSFLRHLPNSPAVVRKILFLGETPKCRLSPHLEIMFRKLSLCDIKSSKRLRLDPCTGRRVLFTIPEVVLWANANIDSLFSTLAGLSTFGK